VHALAVSIGTAHGYYKSEPKLDIDRCRAIAEALPDVPLVLHGGSGTPLADVRKVIESGIAKVNIATEFMDTYLKTARKELNALDGKFIPVDKFYDPVIDACAEHAARLIRFFAGK
jgi:fructose/tagatose bisphosphate aldolase